MENKVKQIIDESVKNIKPFPNLVQKAINLIDSGNVENHELANIIKQDPILSARILSLANSPFYGLSRKVENIETSCVILGLNVIKNILISAGALDCFPVTEQRLQVWSHSVEVAAISELFAKKLEQSESIIYIAGLLHDVGKFLLLDSFPEHKSLIESCSFMPGKNSIEDENRVMGINHAQVGAEIITAWNLPKEIHDIVENHHVPDEASDCVMCSILNLSDEISHKIDANKTDEEIMNGFNPKNIQSIGLEEKDFNDLLPEIREKVDSVKGVVNEL